jgi:hypothetical protein
MSTVANLVELCNGQHSYLDKEPIKRFDLFSIRVAILKARAADRLSVLDPKLCQE